MSSLSHNSTDKVWVIPGINTNDCYVRQTQQENLL